MKPHLFSWWHEHAENLLGHLTAFPSFVGAVAQPKVLARFHQAQLLPEQVRLQAVERVIHLAVETPDSGWIHAPAWQILLTPGDRARLMNDVRSKLVPLLGTDDDPLPGERDEHDDPFEQALYDYQQAFEEAGDAKTASAFQQALDDFAELPLTSSDSEIHESNEDWHQEEEWYAARMGHERLLCSLVPPPKPSRSIFDDIDIDS